MVLDDVIGGIVSVGADVVVDVSGVDDEDSDCSIVLLVEDVIVSSQSF